MEVIDYKLQKHYADNLLKYIYDESFSKRINKEVIVDLVKEHKRVVMSLKKGFDNLSFESKASVKSDLEKLQNLVNIYIHFELDYYKTPVFCVLAEDILKEKTKMICLFLDIPKHTFFFNKKKFLKGMKTEKKLKENYLELLSILR